MRPIRLRNCFWLLVPLLLWNLLFFNHLPLEEFQDDSRVPNFILVTETFFRILVFLLPLFLLLNWEKRSEKWGWVLYIFGSFVYFSGWVILMYWPLSTAWSPVFWILAPYLTPLLIFVGIGFIGRSYGYIFIAVAFTLLHTLHGLYSFQFFDPVVLQEILSR